VQIGQVLLNLVRNGIEAMDEVPAGERVLRVATRLLGENEVETVIHDSGPGVSPGAAATVFEPFFSTKRDGLGMGLSISRSIIEAHHGRIWLAMPDEAPAGGDGQTRRRGAEFHFTLPVKRSQP
jgi:signal transduction histidine kinase